MYTRHSPPHFCFVFWEYVKFLCFWNAEKVFQPTYSFPFFMKKYNWFFIILSFPSRYSTALLVSWKVSDVTRNHTGDSAMMNKVSLCHDIKFLSIVIDSLFYFVSYLFFSLCTLTADQRSRATTVSCLFCNTPRIFYCYYKKKETRIKNRIYFRSRLMPTAAACLPGAAAGCLPRAAAFRAARTPRNKASQLYGPRGAEPLPLPLSPWRQLEIIWTSKLPHSSPPG